MLDTTTSKVFFTVILWLNIVRLNSIASEASAKKNYIRFEPLGRVLIQHQTGPEHNATVIFLHGAGSTGKQLKSSIKEALGKTLAFPHIRILYPDAPIQFYALLMGNAIPVWFDRQYVNISSPELRKSVDLMTRLLLKFIEEKIIDYGTTYNRIVIGGFGMGGSMALHVGWRFYHMIAGVFTLSSFLNYDSGVYKKLEKKDIYGSKLVLPPLFMGHGQRDKVVPYSYGNQTYHRLAALSKTVEFHSYSTLEHKLCKREIITLQNWIEKLLKN